MAERFTCPKGHLWEAADDETDSKACPECGAAAETVILSDTSIPSGDFDELPPPPRTPQAEASPVVATIRAAGDELPQHFGRYEIVEPLGRGGMGTVYLARDSQLDRQVALKVPRFHDGDATLAERFRREAQAAATLDHPNICSVYDVGELDGIQFLSMAYVEGQPLSKLIKDQHPLPERAVVDLVRKLASALAEAHAKGVVHRDLKPANIMINKRHEPVIMDFGLAWREGVGDARLTKAGAIMGTPAYMAPEQVRGDTELIGATTDIYALGVILYELLTGQLPFTGSIGDMMGKISTQPPADPRQLRADISPALASICLTALNKRPQDRYASMSGLADALRDHLGPAVPPTVGASPVADAAPSDGAELAKTPHRESALDSDDLATDLLAKLAAKLDSVHKVQESHAEALNNRNFRWIFGGAAAVLLAGLLFLFTVVAKPEQVTVRFTQVDIWVTQAGVKFLLDGEPVSAERVKAGLSVDAGREHTLVVKQQGEIVARQVFTPEADRKLKVAVYELPKPAQPDNPPRLDSPTGEARPNGRVVPPNAIGDITVDAGMACWARPEYAAKIPFSTILHINGTRVAAFASESKQNIAKYLKPGLNTFVFETTADHSVESWNSLHFTFGPVRTNAEGDQEMFPLWRFQNGESWKRKGDRFQHQLNVDLDQVRVTMHVYYAGFRDEQRELTDGDYVLQAAPYYGTHNTPVTATVFVNGTPLTTFTQQRRRVVITDFLKQGRNEIKIVSRPAANIVGENDIQISVMGPAEHNPRRDGFEFRPVAWFSSMTGWVRNKKSAQLVNTMKKDAETIERVIPVYLAAAPRDSGKTPKTPKMMVWGQPYYGSTSEVPLHSDLSINGQYVSVFTSKTRELATVLKKGQFNEVVLRTVAQSPASSWNSLDLFIGPAGLTEDGTLKMSRLWNIKSGESWKFEEGRLRHAGDPNGDNATLAMALYYAGMEHENQEVKSGDYVLTGSSYNSSNMPSVTSTIYVNGEPLNTFAGVSRQVVLTPLLKAGKNEIKIVTIPVRGQLSDNDINFTIGGPAEYNAGDGKYEVPVVGKFDSIDGWNRDNRTGQLKSGASPDANRIERRIELTVDELP